MLFFLIFIICAILQLVLPWWIIMLIPFALAIWKGEKGSKTFLSAFGAIFMCWFLFAFFIHFKTEGILTDKVAEMLMVKSPVILIFITGIIGGLAAGLAALTGYYCKTAIAKKEEQS
ncbi:hypothetical protein NF867_13575 [Solitalea sp. MAHUQ-68]|uniref:Uncharacterized protein n=1 Tax=Solitalea agri TaxID=2953739 RepID=A0A9X2JDQ7_9SPHI|nr:hypothetical protein [Solitalea agri]MCO4293889.1 hypothetical protein [Solitalea agri]